MTVTLRPYQQELNQNVRAAWASGKRVVVMRLDTGGGKTRCVSALVAEHRASCVIAHRDTIVSQLSLALAECGVRHNIIASQKSIKKIVAQQVKKFNRSYYDPSNMCVVAAVDTIIRRSGLETWAAQVTLWVVDEGHHVVSGNKWDKAIKRFTHRDVRGLLPTATPERPDGKGLGVPELGGDGVAEDIIDGPTMRWMIDEGWLCDYRVVCADSHVVDMLGKVGSTGDWSTAQLTSAEGQTSIVGDVVRTYQQLNGGSIGGVDARTPPRRAVVFTSSVNTATQMLAQYRAAGLVAELVTGDTDEAVRWRTFDRLEAGEVNVVLAVDVISEGTDFPALEVAVLARATASMIVFRQQVGRVLRPLMTPAYKAARTREERLAAIAESEKPLAYIVDHVGNFIRHGPPDRPSEWSLASTKRSHGPTDAIALRPCLNVPQCGQPFERFRDECPHCGWAPPAPAARATPEMVAGDMVLLDAEMLDALRGKADAAIMSLDDYRAKLAAQGLPQHFIWANAKKHAAKIDAQIALRSAMAAWGGYGHAAGLSDRELQRLFHERFGVDVLTACTLGATDAIALMEKILFDEAVKSL